MNITFDPSQGNRRRHGRIQFSRQEAVFLLLLVASMFGLYRHTLKYDLIWDTKNFAAGSLLLNRNRPLTDAFRYGYIQGQLGENKSSFYYRPIMNLSMMLENRLWGFQNVGIRLVNISLFSLALICLFIFLKFQNIFADFAILCTALFAFLPLNADNVIWGVSRCDLFLLLWGWLALIFFHLHLSDNNRLFYVLALVFFALGIYSKETFVFFFPILVIYEWRRNKRISWLRQSAFILIIASFFVIKHAILQLISLGTQPMPTLFANVHLLFSTLGYYVRILFFPIGFAKFTFNSEILNPTYLLFGIGSFVALISYLVATHFKKNILPLSLTAFFLVPFVGLAFSNLWPFKISARYMMIPSIGVIWLFCLCLRNVKRYLRYLICLGLISLFLPYVLRSSFAYKNEISYWADGYNAQPHNGTAIVMLARAHYDYGNRIAAYHYLKKSWKYPSDALTARRISVLSASIEYLRCDYPAALSWLSRSFVSSTYDAYRLRSSIKLAQGDVASAERILAKLIEQYPEKQLAYRLLFNAYIGQTRWDEAARLEDRMNSVFYLEKTESARSIQSSFSRKSQDQLIRFYLEYGNYAEAIHLIEHKPNKIISDQITLVELYYRYGKPGNAEEIIRRMLENDQSNHHLLNALGIFYLNVLHRSEHALKYFSQAIRVHPNQPQIRKLIEELSNY